MSNPSSTLLLAVTLVPAVVLNELRDEALNARPALATAWEAAPDGLSYRFTLRELVKEDGDWSQRWGPEI